MKTLSVDLIQTSQTEKGKYQIYFSGLIISLVYFLLLETTIDFLDEVRLLLKLLAVLLLALHIVFAFSKYSSLWKLIIIITFFLSVIIGHKCDHLTELFVTWATVFGAKDIPKDRLLKVYFKTSLVFCVFTICLALFGIIENNVLPNLSGDRENVFGEVIKERDSFGYIWPTDFATHVFFIFMTFWILHQGQLGIAKVTFSILMTYVLLLYTDSRLGCGCIVLLLIVGVILSYIRNRQNRKAKNIKRFRISFLFVLWIPFLAILSLWATAAYDPTNLLWIAIDLVLSGRLEIGQEALSNYGIPLLGQLYKLHGANSDANLYNYIDSSYLQLFIIYGLCYTVLIIAAFIKLGYQSYHRRDYTLLGALFVAGISGVIAQHFIQVFMNPMLLLLFVKEDDSQNTEVECLSKMNEYDGTE